MLRRFVDVLSVVLLCVYVGEFCHGCTVEEVTECVQPLQSYKIANKSSGIFPYFSDDSLTLICRFYVELEECLKPVRADCDIAQRNIFFGLEAAVSFLCQDDGDDYRQQRKCFLKSGVQEVVHQCNRTYGDQLGGLMLDKDSTVEERTNKLCRYMEEQVRCLGEGVADICGKAAGDWLFTMETIKLTPTLNTMTCFEKSHRLSIPSIFGIMLAVFVFLMFIVLTLVLCQRHQSRPSPLRATKPRSGQQRRHVTTTCTQKPKEVEKPLMADKNDVSTAVPCSQTANSSPCDGLTRQYSVPPNTTVSDNGDSTQADMSTVRTVDV